MDPITLWLLICFCGYASSPVAVEFTTLENCNKAKSAFFHPRGEGASWPHGTHESQRADFDRRYKCVEK